MLIYKNYVAKVTTDYDDGTMHGRIVGIHDIITFDGTNPTELKQAFHETVDDYLALCAERGVEPNRPYSGRLQTRLGVKLHRQLAEEAEAGGVSINSLIRSYLTLRMARRHAAELAVKSSKLGGSPQPNAAGSRPQGATHGR